MLNNATPPWELLCAPRDASTPLDEAGEVTLGQLRATAQAVCDDLRSLGEERLVLLEIADPLLFAAALYGTLLAGKVPVLKGTEFDFRLSDGAHGPGLTLSVSLRREEAGPLPALDPAQRIMLHTSGSTGMPKGIGKTLEAFWRESEMAGQYLSRWLHGDEAVASTVPPTHLFGLTFAIFFPLLHGLPLRRRRVLFPEDLATLGGGRHLLVSSPTFLTHLGSPHEGSGVAVCLSAGGRLGRGAVRRAQAQGIGELIDILGSTETGIMAHREAYREDQWTWFDGVTFDGGRLRSALIEDPQGFLLQDGVRPTGWSTFELLGRLDRVVKVGEIRVDLGEVERVILRQPGVTDAACISVEHGDRTMVGAVVVLEEGVPEGRQQRLMAKLRLNAALKEILEPAALPRLYRFVMAIPASESGKRDLVSLRSLFP
ncbi:MAG: AMP-binding protein [Succinivibrionaceae bacterium]|nr:AMP-binding protein [Succinivibrionaceae bacterium]